MKSGGGVEESSAAAALKKGPWTAAEDAILMEYVRKHGEGNWNAVQRNSGLNRCGKSCRLRWANHLRPNLKKGPFTTEEEVLILHLHSQLGNKWARMAAQLPGRTDNEIKNYWNTRIKRRKRAGLPLYPAEIQRQVLLRHGYRVRPPATSSSAGAVLPVPLPASVPRARLRPPPLSLLPQISFPSSPSPTAAFPPSPPATAPIPFLGQNQFSNGLASQFLLSSPVLPPASPQFQSPHQQQLRFSLSCPVSPTPPSPLFQSQQPMYGNLGCFDVNTSPSSMEMPFRCELPSSQIPGETGGGCGGAAIGLLRSSSTGLLDDMIRELQRDVEIPRVDLQPQPRPAGGPHGGDGHLGGNDVSKGGTFSPVQGSVQESFSKLDGSDSSINGIEKISPVHGNISLLLDVVPEPTMPAIMVAPDWYNSDSGEISNGPSSVMTDDDIGLEMHQLASSLSIAPMDQEWNLSR